MYGEEAEPELYEGFIERALEHLQHLGKIREKPVEFFCKKRIIYILSVLISFFLTIFCWLKQVWLTITPH